MVINMKDNNLKDLFQFLLNHKKLIQCGITVSQGSYSITDLNEGVCVLVERNVPFKEYLSFLEIMLCTRQISQNPYPIRVLPS